MVPIAERQLDRLVDRMAMRDVRLVYTQSVVQAVAQAGYDPAFGARPIKRAVQRLVSDALAENMLVQGWEKGTQVELDWSDKLEVTRV